MYASKSQITPPPLVLCCCPSQLRRSNNLNTWTGFSSHKMLFQDARVKLRYNCRALVSKVLQPIYSKI